jgi:predicted ester cyclase
MFASGDTLAMEWTYTGTQTGALAGPGGTIPPSGRHVTIKGAEFITVNAQGLIVDERGYFDLVSFLTQLGVMPAPQQA